MVAILRQNWAPIRSFVPKPAAAPVTGTVFQRVERFITEIAEAGLPCPTNAAFAAELNYADDAFVVCRTILEKMQDQGIIRIEYETRHKRRIVILKSGLTTGWTDRKRRNNFHGRN